MVRKVDIAVAFIFGILIAIPLSLQFVGAWTGTQNTLSDGYLEVANINATEYYRNDANYTAWIEAQIITDHGGLNGLGDDDHSLYIDKDGLEGLTGNWDAGNFNITADNFTAADFYLESVGNLTAYIDTEVAGAMGSTSSLMGYDYYWNKTGANYIYTEKDGSTTSGGDFDVLLLAVLAADNYIGRHYFGPYTFTYDAHIDMQGTGGAYGRHLIFQGAGAGVTVFEADGAVSLRPHKGIALDLYGITFDLGTSHGIHAYDDGTVGAYGENGVYRGTWDDLEFISGTSGNYAMLLENPEWLRIGNVRIYCASGVLPFKAVQTAGTTYKYGDIQFFGIFTAVSVGGNDVILMHFEGISDAVRLNLFGGSGKIWLKAIAGNNVTGIWLNWVENYNLGKIQVDGGCERLIYVDNSFGGIIDGGMYTSSLVASGSGFNLTSTAYGTLIKDFVLFGTGNCSWANSAVSSPNNYAKFDGIQLWTVAGEFHETIGANTQFERLYKRGGGTYPGRFPT